MFKKIFLISFSTFFVIFTSCSDKTPKVNDKCPCKEKKDITLNIASEPESLDPRKVRDLNSVNIAKMLFDGLVRMSKDGRIECAIAKSFKIENDGKKYIFFLKDCLWSNGEKLTAYDFEYAMKKSLSPDFVSPYSYNLFIVKNAKDAKLGKIASCEIGVKAVDEKTLVIDLEIPCPYFLNLLTQPIFFAVNKKLDEKNPAWALDDKDFVSNGAFKIEKWKHSDLIEIKKNKNYWDSSIVKLNKIKMIMVMQDVELNMYEMNEVDIAGSPFSSLSIDSLKKLKTDKNFLIFPYNGTSFMRINTKRLGDENFRRSIVNAFDRKKIIEHILQGGQFETTRLIPTKEIKNIEVIKKDFSPKTISICYVASDRAHILAQAIQRDLEENLNITVKLQSLEKKIYLDRLGNLDYDIALGSWIADFDDPIDFLNVFKYKDSSTNNTGWENISFRDLLNESEVTLDKTKRNEILTRAENILLNEAPIVPICHLAQNLLKKNNLKDLFIYPSGFIDFKYAYFE